MSNITHQATLQKKRGLRTQKTLRRGQKAELNPRAGLMTSVRTQRFSCKIPPYTAKSLNNQTKHLGYPEGNEQNRELSEFIVPTDDGHGSDKGARIPRERRRQLRNHTRRVRDRQRNSRFGVAGKFVVGFLGSELN
ncbi:hypothetical protein C1H46_012402 [Malus baccata]|uniref:Uncharacterized protein n=1 Tax=Malus baccata TaxID=106549 RepID=A0A540MT64_MALBA|nr:hypothetical protein C1H46_012402 [Malus baccata]